MIQQTLPTTTTTTTTTAQPQRIKGTRMIYPAELKTLALAQVAAGQSIAGTARDLGIVEGTLGMWVAEARKAAGPVAPAEVEPQDMAGLRAALARVTRERDALKAALASVTSVMGA